MIIATASEDGLTEKGFEILYRSIDNLATSHKNCCTKVTDCVVWE